MKITHRALIISVLYFLDGDKKAVDLETLTVSCFKTFPSKFSMDRFPEYPRIDRVRKPMSQIEKDLFVRKEQVNHYRLTEEGIQWVKDNPKIIALIGKRKKQEDLNFQQMLNYNIGDKEQEIEAKKMKRSEAYRKYNNNEKEKISIIDFMNFMKVDIYAKKDLFDRKIKRIKSICLRDNELKKIFNYLEDKYSIDFGRFKKEVKKMS